MHESGKKHVGECGKQAHEAEKGEMRGYLHTQDRGLRNARKPERPAGEGDPIVQNAEDDDLEGKGGDDETESRPV